MKRLHPIHGFIWENVGLRGRKPHGKLGNNIRRQRKVGRRIGPDTECNIFRTHTVLLPDHTVSR